MGMRRGKVVPGAKAGRRSGRAAASRKTTAGTKTKSKARARATAKPARAKRAPRPVVRTVTRTVTRTVEVDRNAAIRELAQRIVDLTIANDEMGMLHLYDPNVESREASAPPTVGIEAIREKFRMWQSMVTSASFRPVAVLADGDTIAIEWSGSVTLAASGRIAQLDEVAVHEIRDGKIIRERFYYDPSVLQG